MINLRATRLTWTLAALTCCIALPLAAQDPPRPTVDEGGTVHGSWMTAPMSSFLSPEGKAALTERLRAPASPSAMKAGTAAVRKFSDDQAKVSLDGWLKIYPSKIEDTTIDGVHVFIVTPEGGVDPRNKNRML